jgi:hypothetical protein
MKSDVKLRPHSQVSAMACTKIPVCKLQNGRRGISIIANPTECCRYRESHLIQYRASRNVNTLQTFCFWNVPVYKIPIKEKPWWMLFLVEPKIIKYALKVGVYSISKHNRKWHTELHKDTYAVMLHIRINNQPQHHWFHMPHSSAPESRNHTTN